MAALATCRHVRHSVYTLLPPRSIVPTNRPAPHPIIITGYKSTQTRKTTPAQRQANQALSAARAPVEHGFSDLKNWRILTRLRLSPAKATTLLRALLVLTRQHTTR
jgi:DDE superfamily endonuclease